MSGISTLIELSAEQRLTCKGADEEVTNAQKAFAKARNTRDKILQEIVDATFAPCIGKMMYDANTYQKVGVLRTVELRNYSADDTAIIVAFYCDGYPTSSQGLCTKEQLIENAKGFVKFAESLHE